MTLGMSAGSLGEDLPMAFCNGYKSPKSLKHRKSLEFPYDLTIMVYCGIMVTY